MLLSVLMPVYNERNTIGTILVHVARCLPKVNKEIIIIDDRSTDGTREWLKANFPGGQRQGSKVDLDADGNLTFGEDPGLSHLAIRIAYHEHNRGKGGALQTGFKSFSGDI